MRNALSCLRRNNGDSQEEEWRMHGQLSSLSRGAISHLRERDMSSSNEPLGPYRNKIDKDRAKQAALAVWNERQEVYAPVTCFTPPCRMAQCMILYRLYLMHRLVPSTRKRSQDPSHSVLTSNRGIFLRWMHSLHCYPHVRCCEGCTALR